MEEYYDEYPAVMFVRLKTGDDVVAELTEVQYNEDHYYMLSNPMIVSYVNDGDGRMQILLYPWVFPKVCQHQDFTIHVSDILLVSGVTETMINYYTESVSSYLHPTKNTSKTNDPIYEEEDSDSDEEEPLSVVRTYH